MPEGLAGALAPGLERLCDRQGREYIRAAPAAPGIERIEACFEGPAFAPHRHDTYALGLTMTGLQTFRYRQRAEASRPGQVIVLHPDELHDGGAGSEVPLRYRMLYLQPALVRAALGDDRLPLPFVASPVLSDPVLARALVAALGPLDEGLDDLLVTDLLAVIAAALVLRSGRRLPRTGPLAVAAVARARACLLDNGDRVVRSAELEAASGLDRFALARQFRRLHATSPHRFSLMRRLETAKRSIGAGEPLAEVAAATGFADQSHLTRHFKRAFGMTPGRWARLSTS